MKERQSGKGRYALGVDIGGTFTDLALLDRASGRLHVGKVLTTYKDLAAGVLDGVAAMMEGSGVTGAEILQIVHGTTLATNALIQRRGAPTALIVTRGFRDVLEFARESRFDIYDIDIEVPPPLVPRQRVYEITERVDAGGAVVTPLATDEIQAIARALIAEGITAAAVCLLHAYRNPAHEKAIAEALARAAPKISVSLSSDVMPDIREYERASTTVANAYVRPAVKDYISRLAGALARKGITGGLHIMASDGGTISAETAARYPVRIVESGPAGGAIASAFLGKRAGIGDVIGFDMGGTTAKFCVIEEGEPERTTAFEVGRTYRFAKGSGLPLKVPVIEMIEIGAGGGSIAHIGQLGLLQVGPESAGADPGPACYGLGGTLPTVTDADLVLGYLDAKSFLGGRLTLDRARAEAAITEHAAKPLGLSLLRAAAGIHDIVNDNMARAAKVHCIERGKDPRSFTLVAYGGAGPVHGYRLAVALGIRRILFPMRAGVMSALGFLVAPPSFEAVRADSTLVDSADPRRINTLLGELQEEGVALVRTAGVAAKEIEVQRDARMRYAGQSFELTVPLKKATVDAAELRALRDRFLKLYEARYRRLNPGVPVEIVAWRVVTRGPRPAVELARPELNAKAERARKGARPIYVPEEGGMVSCAVYDRQKLGAGASFTGPAVIEEAESTAVIGPGAKAVIDSEGNLVVTLPESLKRGRRAARAEAAG